MPHCIVEHSQDLDGDPLIRKVFLGALNSGLFDPEGNDIKVRALSYDTYQTGQSESPFVHVVLKILSGRTAEQKSHLSKTVADALLALGLSDISITVEIVDMDRGSYCKAIR